MVHGYEQMKETIA